MLRLFAAALAACAACSAAHAQDTNVQAPAGVDSPTTLQELYDAIGPLVEQHGSRPLEHYSIIVGPAETENFLVGPVEVKEDEAHRLLIRPFTNDGNCNDDPSPAKYLNNLGFYLIEFCEGKPNVWAWGDFHKLGDAAGAVGKHIGSEKFRCNTNADLLMMTNRARKDFCKE